LYDVLGWILRIVIPVALFVLLGVMLYARRGIREIEASEAAKDESSNGNKPDQPEA
jgi:hypothetical protein